MEVWKSHTFAIFVAVALAAALLSGGAFHSLVPHDHGHSHDGEVAVIWQDLHATLRHENSQVILPIFVLLVLGVLLRPFLHRYVSEQFAIVVDPVRGAALRRGVVPHRKFG